MIYLSACILIFCVASNNTIPILFALGLLEIYFLMWFFFGWIYLSLYFYDYRHFSNITLFYLSLQSCDITCSFHHTLLYKIDYFALRVSSYECTHIKASSNCNIFIIKDVVYCSLYCHFKVNLLKDFANNRWPKYVFIFR